jgi:S1-C subfamily serine protease
VQHVQDGPIGGNEERAFDPGDEDLPRGPVLPPDDRLWRHPSELGAAPTPADQPAAGFDRPASVPPRPWLLHRAQPFLLAALVGALATGGAVLLTGGYARRAASPPLVVRERITQASAVLGPSALFDASSLAAHIRPSLLPVIAEGPKGMAYGTAVVLNADGHLLTSRQLVAGASTITVALATGLATARLVGDDADSDIALLAVNNVTLVPAPMGNAAGLQTGQAAVTVAASHEAGMAPTVTSGVVSGVGRHAALDPNVNLLDLVQIDRPVAPDTVGGALLDASGSVIGLVCGGDRSMGYAVPIDTVLDVARQLLETGRVVHAWLGVEGADLDWSTSASMKLPGGARVSNVASTSPAAKAGVVDGDVVTAIDGVTVTSMSELTVALRHHHPGDEVHLAVLHNGATRPLDVALASRP